MNKIIKYAVINAVLTALYVIVIALFLSNAQSIFGPEEPKTFLVPVVMLLLLVLSAAITGSLVFGRPVMWYLDGNKKEALSLLAYTIIALFVAVIIIASILLIVLRVRA